MRANSVGAIPPGYDRRQNITTWDRPRVQGPNGTLHAIFFSDRDTDTVTKMLARRTTIRSNGSCHGERQDCLAHTRMHGASLHWIPASHLRSAEAE